VEFGRPFKVLLERLRIIFRKESRDRALRRASPDLRRFALALFAAIGHMQTMFYRTCWNGLCLAAIGEDIPVTNHSHVVDNSRVNSQPIWWEVRPVLIMHQEDWPTPDGSRGSRRQRS
jgi:hypothetical protein